MVETPPKVDWDAEVPRLRKLAADGLSGSEIAKVIPGATRNAVVAKCHRLGIQLGNGSRSPNPETRLSVPKAPSVARNPNIANGQHRKPPPPTKAAQAFDFRTEGAAPNSGGAKKPQPIELAVETSESPKTILQVRHGQCRWPISGDGASMLFCAAKTDGTFCERHSSRAYQSVPTGKPKSGNELARSLRRYL